MSWLTRPPAAACSTSFFSWACFSSQRLRSSSNRANRSLRASWYVPKPPPCTQTSAPAGPRLDADDLLGGAGEQLPVVRDEQDGLAGLARAAPPASACRGRPGSCPARRAAAPRRCRAAAPPARAASARRRRGCGPRATAPSRTERRAPPWCTCPTASRPRSRATSAQSESACAYPSCAASSSTVMIACSAASTAFAASRIRGRRHGDEQVAHGASRRGRSPTNCGITPSPPLTVTVPPCGCSSPESSLSRVVLPAPFGPTSATAAPSPTRNETSPSSARPSGR